MLHTQCFAEILYTIHTSFCYVFIWIRAQFMLSVSFGLRHSHRREEESSEDHEEINNTKPMRIFIIRIRIFTWIIMFTKGNMPSNICVFHFVVSHSLLNEIGSYYHFIHLCLSLNICIRRLDHHCLSLSVARRQVFIWTNSDIIPMRPLRTNTSEIWINMQNFHFKNIHVQSIAQFVQRLKCEIKWL